MVLFSSQGIDIELARRKLFTLQLFLSSFTAISWETSTPNRGTDGVGEPELVDKSTLGDQNGQGGRVTDTAP